MGRTLIKNPLRPSDAWRTSLKAAWGLLVGDGAKARVLDAADMAKNTAHRAMNGPKLAIGNETPESEVSADKLEALRDALNDELFQDEEDERRIPPPFVPVDSRVHYQALVLVTDLHRAGQLHALTDLLTVGRDLLATGILSEMVDALRSRVTSEKLRQQSYELISGALPEDGDLSSEPGDTKSG